MQIGSEFQVSVLDLAIFDKEGNKLLELTTLQECHISVKSPDLGIIKATDVTFLRDLYAVLNHSEKSLENDYENYLNPTKKQKITFNFSGSKEKMPVKVVAKGEIRNNISEVVKIIIFNIPNAFLHNKFNLDAQAAGVANTDIDITFEPFNFNQDLFEMIFVNR
jgi:hypothetical protein